MKLPKTLVQTKHMKITMDKTSTKEKIISIIVLIVIIAAIIWIKFI